MGVTDERCADDPRWDQERWEEAMGETRICVTNDGADPVEAWAEVNGETVCSVIAPIGALGYHDAKEQALFNLASALVEHAHEMPRTHPATGVDLCEHGRFAPTGAAPSPSSPTPHHGVTAMPHEKVRMLVVAMGGEDAALRFVRDAARQASRPGDQHYWWACIYLLGETP